MKSYREFIEAGRPFAEEMLSKIDAKMSRIAVRSRNKLPDGVDENGVHIDNSENDPNFWTNGFFGGICALLYKHTGNGEYLKTLESSERLLDKALIEKYDSLHHDVGFMWHLTSCAKYRLTNDPESRKRGFYAANLLMGRLILGGNFIKAWNVEHAYNWTIVDTMMNLPLLYWAAEEFGDDRYKRVAIAHADNTLASHIRPDGSVVHIAEHDRDTGEVIKTHGGQGYAEGSSWSRGQAWALYGFVLSYIHTGDVKYLDAAKRVANYFISACYGDWIPRIDFRAPEEPVYYDSTAGVCAACGLIELGKLLPENEGGFYADAAIKMLRAITDKFANFDPETDDMIGGGSIAYPTAERRSKVHVSIIYGDFFYIEAILKLLGSDFLIW